jgi:hypothetical protein
MSAAQRGHGLRRALLNGRDRGAAGAADRGDQRADGQPDGEGNGRQQQRAAARGTGEGFQA